MEGAGRREDCTGYQRPESRMCWEQGLPLFSAQVLPFACVWTPKGSAQYDSFFLALLDTLVRGDPKAPCFKKTDISKLELTQIIK